MTGIRNHNFSGDSTKSNYHTMTTTTAPKIYNVNINFQVRLTLDNFIIFFLLIKGSVIPTKVGIALPLTILGTIGLVAGLLALTLPETTNTLLPESVGDAKTIDT